MEVTFFNTLFALGHAVRRGHITEAQADEVLMATPGNRFDLGQLQPLLEACGADDPKACYNLVIQAEKTGRIPSLNQQPSTT